MAIDCTQLDFQCFENNILKENRVGPFLRFIYILQNFVTSAS
jgi:hypothetical protein